MRGENPRGNRVTLLVMGLYLLLMFILLRVSEKSYAGVYVPPPKLKYKYSSKYRNPFEPAPEEGEKKLPPPPSKDPDYMFNNNFYIKLHSSPPVVDIGPMRKRPRPLVKPKEELSEPEVVVEKQKEIKKQLGFLWILTAVAIAGVLMVLGGMYLKYRYEIEMMSRPPTYTKYSQKIGTPRRRRKGLLSD